MDERLAALFRSKTVALGLTILGTLGLLALLGPLAAPYEPQQTFEPMLPPNRRHPLGTNDVGHDLWTELLYGARFSLSIALLASILSTGLGIMLGLIAGYYERVGYAVMRLVDIFLAIPRFPLIILMAAFLRPGATTLVLFFTVFGWPRATRLIRSRVLGEREKGYVEAARVIGAKSPRILFRHIWPSTIPIALVRFILEFQHVILAESGLSFLGLGDPTIKSWGNMLHYAFSYPTIFISDVWVHWMLPPGACITLVIIALTLVGFALETQVNPTLRAR
ncbi:MAG: ABC transporter permease [Chloroflexota bacterium]|nr:ABC transporter permease [Chloroflexota bacterium]